MTVIDDGLEGFTTSLYNALNHRKYTTKRVQGIAPQRKRRRLTVPTETEESVDDVSSTEPRSSKMDDYGCVMYNPPLPSSESTTTQEEKRVLLLTLESDASISDLMKRTYATQRVDVINCRPISKLRDVLVKWPHLKHPKFMFQHASTLLDKDVINVWTTELSNKSSDIFQFLNTLCLSLDRKRSVPSHISDLLATKASCDALDDGETVASAIFPLIMWHLREKASAFLQVIKVGASDEDVLAAAKDANGNPVVVLSGDSIFDPNACVRVVLLKDEIIVADNLLEGILYAFLSFFVFGFCYTPEVRHTLEFIQRSLLLINPGKGTKSSSKTRNAVSPKVSKFLEELRIFSSPWTLQSRQQQG
ncbi:uncharacterized protein LOC117639104 [Thrips palmi]|uniref:Uncharacterized protein LOC117639104 n=1 Tax=Thrips palmi TaxID=161013 RepID=A0A6P8ZGN4_THRPL|nr:uncharacterized protein LOC117639104 [Thrips palmi]